MQFSDEVLGPARYCRLRLKIEMTVSLEIQFASCGFGEGWF